MILTRRRNVLEEIDRNDGSVEFHDLVKTNVGTGLAKRLANRLSMQCKPRR